MDHVRTAPSAGIVACALAVAAVVAPYVAVSDQEVGLVTRYYGLGAVTPLVVGLLALIGIMAFAAGLKERSDPSLVAGLMVTVGVFSLVVAVQWVLTVPETVGQQPETVDFLSTHRWSIPAASALVTATAVWYAWALGLLSGGSTDAR